MVTYGTVHSILQCTSKDNYKKNLWAHTTYEVSVSFFYIWENKKIKYGLKCAPQSITVKIYRIKAESGLSRKWCGSETIILEEEDQRPHRYIFLIRYILFVCLTGNSFAYVAHLWVLRDVWIRTQTAVVATNPSSDQLSHPDRPAFTEQENMERMKNLPCHKSCEPGRPWAGLGCGGWRGWWWPEWRQGSRRTGSRRLRSRRLRSPAGSWPQLRPPSVRSPQQRWERPDRDQKHFKFYSGGLMIILILTAAVWSPLFLFSQRKSNGHYFSLTAAVWWLRIIFIWTAAVFSSL